ncbi:MAG TPA: hypothetical protein HPQ04_13775 [Rhodospirillaceae bacterium]|nr:hypothetical protein [Rhodospirillaceae bacterium]
MNNEDDHVLDPTSHAADLTLPNSKSEAEKKRLDLEKLVGYDVFRHDKLVDIVEDVWLRVPERKLAAYTSDQWLKDVIERCRVIIDKATERLREGNPEERIFIMKAKLLRNGIVQQIIRAMSEVSEKYSKANAKQEAAAHSDAATDYPSRPRLPWEEN